MAKNETPIEAVTPEPTPEPTPEAAPVVERAPMAELTGIRFEAGQTDRRIISAQSLRALGVEPKNEEDLVWSRDNDFTIPIASVNAATLDNLIALPEFSAV